MTMTQHQILMDDFRAMRIHDEDVQEERDLGYATERAMHKADGVRQPIVLGEWLRATRRAPSPAEEQDAMVLSACEALDRLNALTAERDAMAAVVDAEVACLVESGMTVTEVGRRLGMSKQRISQRLDAHRTRCHKRGQK